MFSTSSVFSTWYTRRAPSISIGPRASTRPLHDQQAFRFCRQYSLPLLFVIDCRRAGDAWIAPFVLPLCRALCPTDRSQKPTSDGGKPHLALGSAVDRIFTEGRFLFWTQHAGSATARSEEANSHSANSIKVDTAQGMSTA